MCPTGQYILTKYPNRYELIFIQCDKHQLANNLHMFPPHLYFFIASIYMHVLIGGETALISPGWQELQGSKVQSGVKVRDKRSPLQSPVTNLDYRGSFSPGWYYQPGFSKEKKGSWLLVRCTTSRRRASCSSFATAVHNN